MVWFAIFQLTVLEILQFENQRKSSNLIGQGHFPKYFVNQNFPGHGVFAGSWRKIMCFILDDIGIHSMSQFCTIVQKPYFWAIFAQIRANETFPEKSGSVTQTCIWSPNFMQKS